MARAEQFRHRYLTNLALPYVSNDSTIAPEPYFVKGSNVLTSVRGFVERRPGFSVFSTAVTGTIKRLFLWEKWDGTFFLMAASTATGHSYCYKMRIGTDANLVLIYDDTTTTVPFDFVVSNNRCFFGNDKRVWCYEGSGTTVRTVGIGIYTDIAYRPTTVQTTSGTLDAINGGYQYVFAYGNSSTGHLSDISYFSLATGNFSAKKVQITCRRTPDSQVDELHVYRTTDGGGGIYFEISGSPFVHTPGSGTMLVEDETTDVDLSSVPAPVPGINQPPEVSTVGKTFLTWYANRIWGATNNEVHFSGWEEVTNGVEEESWPEGNLFVFPSKVRGLASVEEALLVFLSDSIWRISGDSIDTFRKDPVFRGYGARSQSCIASRGRVVAWLDTGDTLRITDGVSQQELSTPIRPDLEGINHSNASIAFHTQGKRHWLIVSTGSYLHIYDMDTQRWMPPWSMSGVTFTCLASGEVSAGDEELLLAVGTGVTLKMTPSTYTDAGTTFSASVTTSLADLVPDNLPGALGEMEYVGLESSVLPTSVKALTDDDPESATFTDITSNRVNAPRRTQGTYLLDSWYYARRPAARRVAVQVNWAAASTNFKLYSIDIAYKEAP